MSYNPNGEKSEDEDSDKAAKTEEGDIPENIDYPDREGNQDPSNYPEAADDFGFKEPFDSTAEDIQEQPEHRRTRGIIFDLIFYIILVFVCIYIIPNYVVQRTVVDGTSMEDTLFNGDQLYVEKVSYHFDALKRFDIIVFYPYGRKAGDYYVKRVIGLPGETVQIIGSDIYIDGKLLNEHYGKDPITDPGRAAEPITLADDEYFVLGDNRSVSKDSRSEDVGNVKQKNIGGRVVLRIKPLSRFGTVN